jgi:hypothetical protein
MGVAHLGNVGHAQISPVVIRGLTVSASAVSWCIGTLILALVVYVYGDLPSDIAYKSIFFTQYAVTGIAILILPFMPESPAWCISKGKDEQAIKASKRLGLDDEQAQRSVAAQRHTIAVIQAETAGATYAQLFRKSNLRRTMVACMPLTIQPFTGVSWIVSILIGLRVERGVTYTQAGYLLYYTQLAGKYHGV